MIPSDKNKKTIELINWFTGAIVSCNQSQKMSLKFKLLMKSFPKKTQRVFVIFAADIDDCVMNGLIIRLV